MDKTLILQGHLTADDKMRGDYVLLPFEVPNNIHRIEIFLSYSPPKEVNILDIGLFAPGTSVSEKNALQFRGWSGSARDYIVVTTRSATPGYLPGVITPGTWRVILGLYKIGAVGCDYRIEIKISDKEGFLQNRPSTPNRNKKTSLTGPNWFKGDLHSHTHHSDAHCSVEELAEAARERGLDFIAITDHNTISHYSWIKKTSNHPLLIPGEEVTTYYGHANVWGVDNWVDFRFRPLVDLTPIINAVHEEGGIFSINHPKPGGPEWGFGTNIPIDCIEVWQSLWQARNYHSLALWESLLNEGRRVIAVGGSDSHPFHMKNGHLFHLLGLPTTWVYAETLSTRAVLSGIKAGHVFISACPAGPRVNLRAKAEGKDFIQGDVLTSQKIRIIAEVRNGAGLKFYFITKLGRVLQLDILDDKWSFESSCDLSVHKYVRAEVRVPVPNVVPEQWTVAALTNPLWHIKALKYRQKKEEGGK